MPKVTFEWNHDRGEASIRPSDAKRLLAEDWLLSADFLVDVIAEAKALYEKVLLQNREKSKAR